MLDQSLAVPRAWDMSTLYRVKAVDTNNVWAVPMLNQGARRRSGFGIEKADRPHIRW